MNELDLVEAARAAVFLKVAEAIPGLLDHVKQDTKPPYTQLGDIDFENLGSKEHPRLVVSIEVLSVYQGADRTQLLRMMADASNVLNDAELAAPDGVELSRPQLIGGAAASATDGTAYAGVQTFELTVEPA